MDLSRPERAHCTALPLCRGTRELQTLKPVLATCTALCLGEIGTESRIGSATNRASNDFGLSQKRSGRRTLGGHNGCNKLNPTSGQQQTYAETFPRKENKTRYRSLGETVY